MSELNHFYSGLWAIWILLFFAIEGPAIVDKRPGDTLTEHVRWVFSLRGKGKGWLARRAVWFLFLGWLASHFGGG